MNIEKLRERVEKIFDAAADVAQRDVAPVMQQALNDLRQHFEVLEVEEVMGMTVIKLGGKYADVYYDNLSPDVEEDSPNYCTPEARETLDEFLELTSFLGDFRISYCLYDVLK